ncbi:MAG: methyltransferase domain-containing protein [Leptolyngbya sp. SIO1D8]|nr:methyltransferase domain-containing protein [Leptolyngbya sp. SIO1D8]
MTTLAPARNIYIPSPLEQVTRAPDSLQFTLLKLTRSHIEKFVRYTAERGVKIQVFGHIDNARYFKAWKYSFESSPSLPQTEDVLSCTCDIKVHSQFTLEDIREIGYIIKDVLYKVIKEERSDAEFKDYEYGLADHFEDIDSVVSKYDSWAQFYDEEHLRNGWRILLNYLAYSMSKHLTSDDAILDVGCGTGLLGQELNSYGFHDLNGIDISSKSLRIAETLGIYKSLEYAELGKTLKFPNNAFDALLSTGVFARNQVPLNAFDELIRILKPGSLLLIVLRIEDNGFYYKKLKEYYRQELLQEISVEKVSVLESCSHEIVTMRKIASD